MFLSDYSKSSLTERDLQYIQRIDNILKCLNNKPFTVENIAKFDPELAEAYNQFLASEESILRDSGHNEVLVSNPEITAIFTVDLKTIPDEYLLKAQTDNIPIIVFDQEIEK